VAGKEGEEEIQQPRTFSLSAKSNLPNFKLRYRFELPEQLQEVESSGRNIEAELPRVLKRAEVDSHQA